MKLLNIVSKRKTIFKYWRTN